MQQVGRLSSMWPRPCPTLRLPSQPHEAGPQLRTAAGSGVRTGDGGRAPVPSNTPSAPKIGPFLGTILIPTTEAEGSDEGTCMADPHYVDHTVRRIRDGQTAAPSLQLVTQFQPNLAKPPLQGNRGWDAQKWGRPAGVRTPRLVRTTFAICVRTVGGQAVHQHRDWLPKQGNR